MRRARQLLSSDERKKYGVVVTLQSETTGLVHVEEEPGPATGALGRLCDRMEAAPGGPWRIVTVSTPDTIYRDLVSPLLYDPTATGWHGAVLGNQYRPKYEGWLVEDVPRG